MINKELIKDKLLNRYLEKDVTILMDGDIATFFTIHNCNILINDYRLILTNSKKEEIILSFDDVTDVKFEKCIILEYGNQTVTIDC